VIILAIDVPVGICPYCKLSWADCICPEED
jgi:hypothetical protein